VVLIFNFNIFNILLFGRWVKSIKPSPHNIIHRRQNLLELTVVTHFSSSRYTEQATGWTIGDSIPSRDKRFFCYPELPDLRCFDLAICFMGTPWYKAACACSLLLTSIWRKVCE
jgi:hypothetical protein